MEWTSSLEQKWISLDLNVDKNKMHFKLANSRSAEHAQKELPGKEKGISLENVKRAPGNTVSG